MYALTKSLALNLVEKKTYINCVTFRSVWMPNIAATMPEDQIDRFNDVNAMGRAGQPEEIAPAYVYFAAEDRSFRIGALLDVTGGQL
ncbi:MAG: SDR family oxidoreductase [Cyanobacteria bacterium J06581_3]